jgi:Uma2 family endonuclease
MVTAAHLPSAPAAAREREPEQRVLLHGVPWSTYVVLCDTVDRPGVRMTYLEGMLEIMTTSRTHEVWKKQIARLLELFCLERDIPLYGFGQMTMRKEEHERGLEPDECYSRDTDKETPDIALEVVVSRPLIDKLEVYRKLGVREVWVFEEGELHIHASSHAADGEPAYVPVSKSEIFPEIDLTRLAHHALEPDQHAALRAYRDELRAASPDASEG